jgi:hypothetical protein
MGILQIFRFINQRLTWTPYTLIYASEISTTAGECWLWHHQQPTPNTQCRKTFWQMCQTLCVSFTTENIWLMRLALSFCWHSNTKWDQAFALANVCEPEASCRNSIVTEAFAQRLTIYLYLFPPSAGQLFLSFPFLTRIQWWTINLGGMLRKIEFLS